MNDAYDPLQSFLQALENYLQDNSRRMTAQRHLLAKHVVQRSTPFTADEVVAALSNRNAGEYVSRPSIYRHLNEFVDAGLIQQIRGANGRCTYDIAELR